MYGPQRRNNPPEAFYHSEGSQKVLVWRAGGPRPNLEVSVIPLEAFQFLRGGHFPILQGIWRGGSQITACGEFTTVTIHPPLGWGLGGLFRLSLILLVIALPFGSSINASFLFFFMNTFLFFFFDTFDSYIFAPHFVYHEGLARFNPSKKGGWPGAKRRAKTTC